MLAYFININFGKASSFFYYGFSSSVVMIWRYNFEIHFLVKFSKDPKGMLSALNSLCILWNETFVVRPQLVFLNLYTS